VGKAEMREIEIRHARPVESKKVGLDMSERAGTRLGKWRRHHLGLDAMIVGSKGVSVYCPVCCRPLLIDGDTVRCAQCGSQVRVNISVRETLEGQAWIK